MMLLFFVLSGYCLPESKEDAGSSTIPTPPPLSQEQSNSSVSNDIVDDSLSNYSPEPGNKSPQDEASTSKTETSGDIPSNTLPQNEATAPSDNETSSDQPNIAEKIWVPPVYETIHHEAVYETKKVVICNYCNEVFYAVGEFQIHKNETGG